MTTPSEALKYLEDRGGPMCPIIELPIGGGATYSSSGMTARDHFAGVALAGICSNDHALNNYVPQQCAEWAYQFADAMLAERSK